MEFVEDAATGTLSELSLAADLAPPAGRQAGPPLASSPVSLAPHASIARPGVVAALDCGMHACVMLQAGAALAAAVAAGGGGGGGERAGGAPLHALASSLAALAWVALATRVAALTAEVRRQAPTPDVEARGVAPTLEPAPSAARAAAAWAGLAAQSVAVAAVLVAGAGSGGGGGGGGGLPTMLLLASLVALGAVLAAPHLASVSGSRGRGGGG